MSSVPRHSPRPRRQQPQLASAARRVAAAVHVELREQFLDVVADAGARQPESSRNRLVALLLEPRQDVQLARRQARRAAVRTRHGKEMRRGVLSCTGRLGVDEVRQHLGSTALAQKVVA